MQEPVTAFAGGQHRRKPFTGTNLQHDHDGRWDWKRPNFEVSSFRQEKPSLQVIIRAN